MTATGGDVLVDDLYRDIILDHYRSPRRRRLLDAPAVTVEGVNPFCGDQVKLSVLVEGERLADIGWRGSGCSISQASASLLAETLTGATKEYARRLRNEVESMLIRGESPAADLGDLEALQGVAKFHARVKCALLVWRALDQALSDEPAAGPVSSEDAKPAGSSAPTILTPTSG